MKKRIVEYQHGGLALEGFLAAPDDGGKRPGVLVLHEWWGINDHVRHVAEQLAGWGYVALAADLYGKDVRAKTGDEAAKLSGALRKSPETWRGRARAGLDVLANETQVDAGRLGAVGFCFGGTTALELARSGAPLRGVASVHGALVTASPDDAKRIQGRVLALHGGADPLVPWTQVDAFQKEMNAAGVDWTLVAYGGAVHAFTNPAAGTDASKGLAFDAVANQRAERDLKAFFAEVF
ncbi:MAG: dienelactone hydrolase family protein [Myxococcaceae bacterium]